MSRRIRRISEIVYGGLTVSSVLAVYPHSFIASSNAKSLSLPGGRIGYIAVNRAIAALDEIMGGLTLFPRRKIGKGEIPAVMPEDERHNRVSGDPVDGCCGGIRRR